jgi:hypothetical protein
MEALINPTGRTKGRHVRWVFVAQTVVMFSILSIDILMNVDLEIISYIDNEDFPVLKTRQGSVLGPLRTRHS